MIHIIVGNTGAGKTTYAYKLKKDTRGVVFSIDKWNNTLFFRDKSSDDGVEWILERIERSEEMIMDLILQLEQSGTDVILDLGFAKKERRDKFRAFADKHEIDLWLHYIDIPTEIRSQRIAMRNEKKGDTYEFEVTQDQFDFMENWFEPPTTEELEGAIIVNK